MKTETTIEITMNQDELKYVLVALNVLLDSIETGNFSLSYDSPLNIDAFRRIRDYIESAI